MIFWRRKQSKVWVGDLWDFGFFLDTSRDNGFFPEKRFNQFPRMRNDGSRCGTV